MYVNSPGQSESDKGKIIALQHFDQFFQFVRIYPKNIRMESNATKDYVGGTADDGKLQLLRSMPPIRRPSPRPRYQTPM